MSLGYASRLSYRDDLGGQLGAPEHFDATADLEEKVTLLAEWVKEASKVVVFTGAGISTACGIPDFRGPNGVWTLQKAGKPLPKFKTTFEIAKPSVTHQALAGLVASGKVSYIVSQNVDGIHLRTGVERNKIAELHGNCFSERCGKCKKEYIRDFEMDTVGFRQTGRRCIVEGCHGRLKDHILDWDDALPDDELTKSEEMAAQADLAVCLGTSLQIVPARDIPIETVKAGGKLVIVNLQETPKDKDASLLIRGKSDQVMGVLMRKLEMKIPPYIRRDACVIQHRQSMPRVLKSGKQTCMFQLEVVSMHGHKCRLPIVKEVAFKFPENPGIVSDIATVHPFGIKRHAQPGKIKVKVILHLGEGADSDKRTEVVHYVLELLARSECETKAKEGQTVRQGPSKMMIVKQEEHSFVTQEVHFESGEMGECMSDDHIRKKQRVV